MQRLDLAGLGCQDQVAFGKTFRSGRMSLRSEENVVRGGLATVRPSALAAPLQHMPDLRKLYVDGNGISGAHVHKLGAALAAVPHLTSLTLWSKREWQCCSDMPHWAQYVGLAGCITLSAIAGPE